MHNAYYRYIYITKINTLCKQLHQYVVLFLTEHKLHNYMQTVITE